MGKPITKAEVDIFMCRLQGAIYEEDKKRIEKILKEIKEREKEANKKNDTRT
ncbi:MAG: hypothetical protein ACFFDN_00495 [Candidatus Hodarchaeota archaeon]